MKLLVVVVLVVAVTQVSAVKWRCCAMDTVSCAACLTACAICDAATPAGAAACSAATLGCLAQCMKCVNFGDSNQDEFNISVPLILSPFDTVSTPAIDILEEPKTAPVFTNSGKEAHFHDVGNTTVGGCIYGASNYCMTQDECAAGCAKWYGTDKWCLYNDRPGTHYTGCCQCDTNCPRCSSGWCPCTMGCNCN